MKNEPIQKIKRIILFLVFLAYLYILTFVPYEFSNHWLTVFLSHGTSGIIRLLFHLDPSDIFNNIVFFIPLGWIFHGLVEAFGYRPRFWIIAPIVCGMLISASIETAQLFLNRSTSVIDLLANTVGTVFGFYSAQKWHWHQRVYRSIHHLFAPFALRLGAVILYACGLIYLLLLPFQFNGLSNWDETFPLLVGNEATQNKPWNGDVSRVALFSRALHAQEIRQLFQTVTAKTAGVVRIELEAEAFYPFIEGKGDTVHDFSRMEPLLPLSGKNPFWCRNAFGIQLNHGAFLFSSEPAEKIIRVVKKTACFTVEFRVRTRTLDQTGPARIVSISTDLDNRNMSLGQEGSDLIFRVRTPFSGPNSSRFYLTQSSAISDTLMHHFVAVFDHGVMKIYRDGRLLHPIVRGDIPYLPMILRLGKNAAAKSAFCFIFFFPFGILLGRVFRKCKFLWTLACASVLFTGVAGYSQLQFQQPFGWLLFAGFVFFAWLGAVAVKLFETSP